MVYPVQQIPNTTEVMKTRDGVKIFISETEKASLDRLLNDLGMKQTEAGTRIFRWFLKQDDVIQRKVLGLLPESVEADVAEIILGRMAKRDRSGRITELTDIEDVVTPATGQSRRGKK